MLEQKKYYRSNHQIKISPIMVILGDQNLGVMPTNRALELAALEGLDLVEIAPHACPPVCKIIDYGKFKYEQSIKEKAKVRKSQQMKELRMGPSIASHDLAVKINYAQRFLEAGNKVQIKVEFKRRENSHKELGFNVINQIINALAIFGKPSNPPQFEGKNINCVIEPAMKK